MLMCMWNSDWLRWSPKCITRDTEVCESIVIVHEDWMAAVCTLLSFVSVTLAISLYCTALCYCWL